MTACQRPLLQPNLCQPAFHTSKVEIASLFSPESIDDPTEVFSSDQLSPRSRHIHRGQDLVVVRDEACNSSHHTQSYRWIVERDISEQQLHQLVDTNKCVIGVADGIQQTISAEVDPLLSEQSHLVDIGAVESIDQITDGHTGPDLILAIIDTGVDLDHEDLRDNRWRNSGEIANNGIDDDANGYIDDYYGYNFADHNANPQVNRMNPHAAHGTHVAGLAAARRGNYVGGSGVMGMHVKIMALNVFGSQGSTHSSAIDNAIRYAADNGADVINLSLGGLGASSAQRAAIEYAIQKGALVVAAAGNEARSLDHGYFVSPASYAAMIPGMISVGSIDVSTHRKSEHSNYGANSVKIAAPGAVDSTHHVGLVSTLPGNRYGRLQGTSMATGLVSGAALLAKSILRDQGTPAKLEAWLEGTARSVKELANQIHNGKVLDVNQLVTALHAHPDRTPSETAWSTCSK
jgi:subtilisin family serine protease